MEKNQLVPTVILDRLQYVHVGFDTGQQLGGFGDIARLRVVHDHTDHSAGKTRFQMLVEVFTGSERVVPHCYRWAVVDGKAKFSQGHVQLVHSETKYGHHILNLGHFFNIRFD